MKTSIVAFLGLSAVSVSAAPYQSLYERHSNETSRSNTTTDWNSTNGNSQPDPALKPVMLFTRSNDNNKHASGHWNNTSGGPWNSTSSSFLFTRHDDNGTNNPFWNDTRAGSDGSSFWKATKKPSLKFERRSGGGHGHGSLWNGTVTNSTGQGF
ncbi:hypothetical protein CKM354_001117900 [Cercospora kikuchii]|uniref:Uncharacterized protein n=1 Tax=Cercospora kikuchii TaxID=84275 RepID=A0A9P3FI26_9PEZI|nr:uncharacterized protein CKM354_001117900 [Cercospora kikuchii]GIZ48106.1 hypothetical protein CKM354_001117900 [Cercospora kikuchii]